ncbi:host specificity factor TipJ family phage tail protein [Halomonas elongata]|uniref:host specificity factor TipJ family phage tail protein n=1 Tax=Halomonas elongata TaxID=2746 RepID=UPI00186B8276|nr:host specificity factor TipJ family phage tail protein [Halomonas elongata]MBW5800051.1 DUF1983 domain-containing protein [Halomonas elongata]
MVQLAVRPNPLRSDLYVAEVPDGISLFGVVGDLPASVQAQVDGEVIPRERWAEPLPAGSLVTLYSTPQDDVGRAVAMIAVTVAAGAFAPALAGAIGVAGFTGGTAAVTAGLTVAGSLAVNALIPPKLPSQHTPTSPNVRESITGTQNRVDKYGVVPRAYGNPRWFPKLASNPVTEIAGNDQYLRMLVCLGYGPLEIAGSRVGEGHPLLANATAGDDIRIGDTSLDDYEDVEWEVGLPDQLTLMTPDIQEDQVGVSLPHSDDLVADQWVSDGATATRTTAPNTREISLDLVFPSGFFCINDNGTRSGLDVEFKIEYREAGASTWIVQDDAWHLGGDQGTKDTYRLNRRWGVPEGQYDVRVTRVRSRHGGIQGVYTDCQWSVLRSVQDGPAYTGNHVLLALRIRATDQLNGVIDRLNVRTQAVLRVWTGTAWEMQATSNPAWAYLDVLTGPQVGRPVSDNRLDIVGISEWAGWCDNQGLHYHWVHDTSETLFERAKTVAAAGQASFGLQDGLFGVVRDDPNAPTLQTITPRNAMGFSASRQYKDLPHAIRVKYIDPDTWSDAERIIYRDGYDESNATRFEDFETQGVAGAEEAWHHGNYYLRQAILRPETFQAKMDWEHLAIVRGNRVNLAYDAIKVGLGSARVKSVNGATVVLDERLEYTEQRAYGLIVRTVDEQLEPLVRHPASQVTGATIGETDTFTLVDAIDIAPGDLVTYGVLGREALDCKVTRIDPGADFSADVTLVNAATDIYDYSTAPEYDPGITNPIPPELMRPPVPHITSVRGDETAAQQNQDGSFTTLIRVAYAFRAQVGLPNLQVEARYRVVGSAEWEHAGLFTASGNLTIRDVDEELDYEIQLRALNGAMASVWSQTATLTVTGQAVQAPRDIEVQRGNFTLTLIPHGLYAGAQYEFWRSSAPLALGDVETSAQRLSVGAVLVDTDLMPDTTYYYYVRQWTVNRVSAFVAVEATTRNDPSAIISNISGEIHEGVLDPALRERVEQIGVNTGAIAEVQDDLAQTRQDLSDEAARLDERVDGVQTGLDQTQQELDDETARLDGRVDTVQGDLADESARLDGRVSSVQNSLETTRNNLEAADADLDQRLEEAETAIVDEAEARRTEDGFIANRLTGLQDTSDQHDLRIGELQRLQQEGDQLEAIIYEALNAETANRRASIRTEERVRIDGDSALAVRADSLEASVGDLDAAITTEQQARADEDSVLASQIGELSAKIDSLPRFNSNFHEGSDFDQWTPGSDDSIAAETTDPYTGTQSALITSAAANPASSGSTGATYADVPSGATDAFTGHEIVVTINARQPANNAATEFAAAYSTASVGNSGWQTFTPGPDWGEFEFRYTVPEGSNQSTDYIAIWADTSGSGAGVVIGRVHIRRVAGEVQEITAALQEEQQARIDGDEALASDLQNMDARVGDVESGLTAEQQVRADADSAMASDIQDMDARVGDVESGLTTEQQVRADADSALASRASSLEARTGDVEAGLTSEEQARTNADEALGSRLTAVEATSGDNTATITDEAEVRATEDEAHALAIDRMSLNNQQQSAAIAALQRLQQEGEAIEAIQFESINVETANRRASIRTEERVRIDKDSALAVRSDQLEASIGDNAAAITAEQQARADGDSALASDLSSLDTRVGDAESSLTQEQQARIDGDQALASDVSSLDSRLGSAESAITAEQQARVDGDSALASRASSLESRMGDAETSITEEEQARIDGDDALASRASSLETRMGSAETSITQEEQARADGDSALASDIENLQASLGADYAALQTQFIAEIRGQSLTADGSFSAGDGSLWANTSDVNIIQRDPSAGAIVAEAPAAHFAQYRNHTAGGNRHVSGQWQPVSPGDVYSVKMDYSARSGTDGTLRLSVQWQDAGGNNVGWPTADTVDMAQASDGVWRTTTPASLTAPAGAAEGRIVVTAQNITSGNPVFTNVIAARADAAMAQRIDTVQTQLGGDIASVEQTAQANIDAQKDRIDALWTLRVDVNGRVTGIGLHNDGQQSEFGVIADRMYIVDPDDPASADVPFIFDNGRLLLKEALIDQLTFGKLTDGSGNFIVDSNGRIKAEYLVVDSAQSSNYQAGQSGWKLSKDGSAELNNVKVRGDIDVRGLTVNNSAPSFVFTDSYSDNNTIHYIWGQSTTDNNAPLIEGWRSVPEGIRYWSTIPYSGNDALTFVNLVDRTYTVNARGPSSSAFINLDVDLQYYLRAALEDSDMSVAMAEFDGELLVYDGSDLVRRSVLVHGEDKSRGNFAEAIINDAVNISSSVAIKLKETDGDVRVVFRLRGYAYTQRYADGHNAAFIFESRRCEMDALISRI